MPYSSGIVSFTSRLPALLFDEAHHQVGELEEISGQKRRATVADHDLWIRGDDVGPLPRHRADAIVVDAQQEPRPVPVAALADADELPSAQGVERVDHAHKTRARARRACSSC